MERRIIHTENLTFQDLPSAEAGWGQLAEFALLFDPVIEIGKWTWSTDLLRFSNSSSVKELRSYIYFMQRAWHDGPQEIPESSLDEMRSAVLLIRSKLLKGFIPFRVQYPAACSG